MEMNRPKGARGLREAEGGQLLRGWASGSALWVGLFRSGLYRVEGRLNGAASLRGRRGCPRCDPALQTRCSSLSMNLELTPRS